MFLLNILCLLPMSSVLIAVNFNVVHFNTLGAYVYCMCVVSDVFVKLFMSTTYE